MLIKLVRLGRDAEVRHLTNGDPVTNLALAYNYGQKDNDGNRPTQWIEAAFWGERGTKAAPYLLKGTKIVVTLDELHVEEFQRSDNTTGTKLVARLVNFEFAGSRPQGEQSGANSAPARSSNGANSGYGSNSQQARKPAGNANPGDFEDDIPF